ncbi:MAG: L,D-transpeptidase [Pyrinomonadaceae bacterium]|nr:L,D-transpeptidase [Pyrinomonadaceae bacterium]
MKNFSRAAFVAAFAFSLSGAGCVTEPTKTTTDTTATNTNTTVSTAASPTVSLTASPTISPTPVNASNMGLPVTLPVIDAFFAADETFAADLTRRLQLTDAQVDNLRTIARVEKEKLREAEIGEYQGSTANAQTLALNRIKEAIGEAKAQQFAEFVRERWSTGGEGSEAAAIVTGNTTPNAVPTDTRIVVNAPAYRMDVFKDGQLTKSYKVGIGYPEFPLPTGLRKATTIIYNPTWTPPDEPWVEGSNEVKAGQMVAAGSKLNPLGPVKIPIGSPSLIHGGKTPAKLGSFASHGCVGLTDPQVLELSRVIADISGTELTDEDVAAYTKVKTETKNVKLTQQIPVELRYETIVVEDGKLHIYRDVYDRDTNTEDNLRRVLEAHGVQFDQLSEPKRAQVMTALQRMARDAQGNPMDAAASPSPPPSFSPTASSNKNANNSGDRVTRTVKGQKEIVIEIAALKGKGYPAPVNLNTGSAQNKRATASSAQAGKRR